MDLKTLPEVAKSIYYPCNKCDRERYFKVITHLSETEAKIECEVCKAKRKLNIAKKPKKKSTRTRKNSAAAHEKVYVELRDKNAGKSAVPYGIAGNFPVDSVIDHPTFGIGYVTTSLTNKIEVVFAESVKNLVHKKN